MHLSKETSRKWLYSSPWLAILFWNVLVGCGSWNMNANRERGGPASMVSCSFQQGPFHSIGWQTLWGCNGYSQLWVKLQIYFTSAELKEQRPTHVQGQQCQKILVKSFFEKVVMQYIQGTEYNSYDQMHPEAQTSFREWEEPKQNKESGV